MTPRLRIIGRRRAYYGTGHLGDQEQGCSTGRATASAPGDADRSRLQMAAPVARRLAAPNVLGINGPEWPARTAEPGGWGGSAPGSPALPVDVQRAPRYDAVFYEGLAWLNALDRGEDDTDA